MEKRTSNYEIMKHRMQIEFAANDQDKIAEEWELDQSDGYLKFEFVSREYFIEKESGRILYDQNGIATEADYNVSMTLFDILTRKRQSCAGRVMPISSFSRIQSANTSSGGLFDRSAKAFDGRDEDLASACRKIGGKPYGKGDVGYIFPVFRDLQMAVQFWDSDDEFPAELTLFCDANTLQYMHFETMMFMIFHVLERLSELMGSLP